MTVLPVNPGTPPPAPAVTRPVKPVDTRPRPIVERGEFRRELDARVQPQRLTLSRHAMKRLNMRGIEFTPQGLERIEQAVDRAAEKGSKDALVIAGGLALVVSVSNRTVITVMSRDAMQDSVVTNIDSAVFA